MLRSLLSKLMLSKEELLVVALGTAIMAFGIVNIHTPAKITEGGVLGLVLFSYRIFGWEPSTFSIIADITCYAIGFSLLGKDFIRRAFQATLSFALFYKLFLWVGPILPNLYSQPFVAAVLGGISIGVGCGLCVSQGCAAGGDDALAMVIAKTGKFSISRAYLLTDGVVLLLSLIYIEPSHLVYSALTTIVSSLIIGQFEIHFPSLAIPQERVLAKA